jgi:hypothetical protein
MALPRRSTQVKGGARSMRKPMHTKTLMSIHESSGVRDRIPNIEEVILPNQADKERKFNSSSYHFDKKMAREKALNPAE